MTRPGYYLKISVQLLTLLFSASYTWTTIAANKETGIDNPVFGLWASEGSIFRTYYEDNTVKGEILALREPVYTQDP